MPILFFAIAFIYAMVGFGGGSSYIAILALAKIDYLLIPIIALICNIIVVSGGVAHASFHKKIPFKIILPFLAGSIPFSYLGGSLKVSKEVFLMALALTLCAAGLRVLLVRNKSGEFEKPVALWKSLSIGSLLGFVSGLVGIGGGVFLAPILLNFNWAPPKKVAGAASFFILVNSIFGLLGQMLKGDQVFLDKLLSLSPYSLLFAAVFFGGQLGSLLSFKKLPEAFVKKATGLLVLFVGLRLLFF